jgi:N-methylhydantoinase A/acetophenone carboxylase
MERAKKELEGEGLPVEEAVFSLELDMLYGGQVHRKRASSPLLFIESEEDVRAIYNRFEQEFSETFSPLVVHPEGGVYVENFVLRASIPTQKPRLPEYELEGEDASKSLKEKREAFWEDEGMVETSIYDYALLKPGNVVEGPAIIESEYTTIIVPQEFSYSVDKHGFGRLKRR